MEPNSLAVLTADQMAQVFHLISGNLLVTRVFFELARETPFDRNMAPLHAISLSDILQHVQLAEGHQLFDCLSIINKAVQRVLNDPDAVLFASDEVGHIYLHETTYRSIRQIWEQLILAHASPLGKQVAGTGEPVSHGFEPAGLVEQEPVMPVEHAFSGVLPGAISQ